MEGDGGSGKLLDLTSTENKRSVERGFYQFKINILTIVCGCTGFSCQVLLHV